MIYVCVDCEASGPVPPLYNLLSIGATVVRPDGGRHALGRSFYVELQPIFPGFDPGAMAVCGLDAERLKREGRAPREAMTDLARFAREAARGETERPVFVGHNAVFDWSYIAYYYAHFGMENPFGYKGLDTKSLAMGRLGVSWNDTSKESLERLLGLPPQDPSRVHRADYDAEYQARILVALLDRMPREPARP
ncbi:MAG TPA: 3'-5' exonuclease [Candidatus Sulfotelmatobacter sp.]|nr:3'-5' exonuclease [Candidatus Sulfotelmatobacter sp.]